MSLLLALVGACLAQDAAADARVPPAAPPRNRLGTEKSPYLQAHADDPVDWYPWGDEAFSRAQKEDKLVFLSSGYSACHWCHVMERESFEDPEIARFMNERFISIKIDREERPDVDAVYLQYVMARTGSGGWPLSVILTSDKRPIFGGTYFPPRNVESRPGLSELLHVIDEEWRTRREDVLAAGAEAAEFLRNSTTPSASETWPKDLVARALESWVEITEIERTRPPRGPLFPMTTVIELALLHGSGPGDSAARAIALSRLDAMAAGGIRDVVGGGFARYSVDGEWRVPHFEKMLYVNALLARAYTMAYLVTKKPRYERVARETLDFLLREMTLSGGAFATALDADSITESGEHVEGYFYTFTRAEVEAALTPELAHVAIASFSISESGDLDGRAVLRRPPDSAGNDAEIEAARAALFELRKQRPPPIRDEKVLVDMNGLAISAFALAGRVFREPRYKSAARQAVEFLKTNCFDADEQRLTRRYCDGEVAHAGQLSDYAFFAAGLLDLYATEFDVRNLDLASEVVTGMLLRFYDAEHGVFFDTPKDGESLPMRPRDGADGSLPSASAVAVSCLIRLARTTERKDLEALARRCIESYVGEIRKAPLAYAEMLRAGALVTAPSREIVFAGTRFESGFEALVDAWYSAPRFGFVAAHAPADDASREAATAVSSLIEGRVKIDGRAAAFVCENRICGAPIVEPGALLSWTSQEKGP